jgi:hypothetical protein
LWPFSLLASSILLRKGRLSRHRRGYVALNLDDGRNNGAGKGRGGLLGKIVESHTLHGDETIVIDRDEAFAIFSALKMPLSLPSNCYLTSRLSISSEKSRASKLSIISNRSLSVIAYV